MKLLDWLTGKSALERRLGDLEFTFDKLIILTGLCCFILLIDDAFTTYRPTRRRSHLFFWK